MTEQLTQIDGLPQLLRAVAGRIESDIDGLNKTLLLQSAEKLDELELVAEVAVRIVNEVKHSKDRAESAKVSRRLLVELMRNLEAAGKQVRTIKL
jgi:hypothetical protein